MTTTPHTPQEIHEDMQRRIRPTAAAYGHALALLAAEPRAEVAFIPMILPGKTRSVWIYGQEVCTVPGVVLLASRNPEGNEVVPGYSHARDTCWRVARGEFEAMGTDGVTACVVVERDGTFDIFQD
jgi:hypothetical protein